jgi:hypothetical protein
VSPFLDHEAVLLPFPEPPSRAMVLARDVNLPAGKAGLRRRSDADHERDTLTLAWRGVRAV